MDNKNRELEHSMAEDQEYSEAGEVNGSVNADGIEDPEENGAGEAEGKTDKNRDASGEMVFAASQSSDERGF